MMDIHKIIIPKEPKQECMITKSMHLDAEIVYKSLCNKETLEEDSFKAGEDSFKEFRKTILDPNRFDFVCGFTEGAKWQSKRMYSEEEVLSLILNFNNDKPGVFDASQWFEEFKKK